MKDLSINQKTLDSREVAQMIGKEHNMLLRSIRGYVEIIKQSADLHTGDFFISSTYKNENNQSYPCFKLTRKGCDMVANKITGRKGVLFTAQYVTRFEEMEEKLNRNFNVDLKAISLMHAEVGELIAATTQIETRIEKLENAMTIDYSQQVILQDLAKAAAVDAIGGKDKNAYKNSSVRGCVFSQVWKDYKEYFQVNSYKNTPKTKFEKAKEYLNGWKPPGKLQREIEDINDEDIQEYMDLGE